MGRGGAALSGDPEIAACAFLAWTTMRLSVLVVPELQAALGFWGASCLETSRTCAVRKSGWYVCTGLGADCSAPMLASIGVLRCAGGKGVLSRRVPNQIFVFAYKFARKFETA